MSQHFVNRIDPLSPATRVNIAGMSAKGPWFDVTHPDFGAKLDGSTNDGPALQAAIDTAWNLVAASGQRGAEVLLPNGILLTNQQIVVREGVTLRGVSRVSSCIKAGPSFPVSTSVVLLGHSTEALTFGARLVNVSVDCNSIAGSIGVESTKINEYSGLEWAQVFNYMSRGVYIHGSVAQNYFLRELYVLASASASGTYYGVDLDGGGSALRGLDGITVDHLGSGSHTAGVRVNNASSFLLSRLHVENCTDGVLVGDTGSCSAFAILGVSGSAPITTIVRVTAGQSFHVAGVQNISGATNALVDTLRTVTLTDTSLPLYAVGDGASFQPSLNLSDASGATSTFRTLFAKDNLFVGSPGHNTGISRIKHGTSAAMTAGVVTIADPDTTGTSRIVYTRRALGGTAGHVSITAQAAGTFTLTSGSATETSTFNYYLFEP